MLKYLIRSIVLIAVFVLLLVIAHYSSAEAPALTPEERLDAWVDKLAYVESKGNDMVVVLDSNNRYSFGCLQFQMATFQTFSKKYGITEEIMDCDAQKKLAKLMIKDDPNSWKNWYNSVTKYGVGKPPQESL